ncbi:hypothetical protein TWF694_005316 [Orbilia ellipsospora]|uniref:F-box domain-containing protein n=1 Tax=Orbilia ellipsospora TaxID=2528407 RepID=A0AAV9WUB8_9PEZI
MMEPESPNRLSKLRSLGKKMSLRRSSTKSSIEGLNAPTGIHSLPVEIHTEILTYLSFVDQTRACAAYKIWEDILLNTTSFYDKRYVESKPSIHKILADKGITVYVRHGAIEQYKMGCLPENPGPSSGLVFNARVQLYSNCQTSPMIARSSTKLYPIDPLFPSIPST